MSERTDALRAQMTPREKADLVAGDDMWHTVPIARLGIPPMKVTDGPNGARGDGLMGTGTPTACIPSGAALGASWDPGLAEELGSLLGAESRAKKAHVLLAPTINLHRSPKGGRNFECYSEDPLLTGTLAAAYIRGVQSHGVGVTAKHFVGNDSEFERNTIDTQIDERTMREVALLPFEMAVKEGGAWGIMTAYNRLNGVYCSEHEWLIRDVLRGEWGFDGMVVTDWFANGSTAGSVAAQMTLEMPGKGRFYGDDLYDAMLNGDVAEEDVDTIVDDLLRMMERTGSLDDASDSEEKPLDRPEDRILMRRAAAAGSVLLRNDGVLPIDLSAVSSVAVIGPNAMKAKVMGGGSATVRAYHQSSPYESLVDRFPDLDVRYAQGADIDRDTPPLGRPLLQGLARVEYSNGWELDGETVVVADRPTFALRAFGSPATGVEAERWCARLSGTIQPEVSGPHQFRVVQAGRTLVRMDGEVLIDATADKIERGDSFFGFGSIELLATVDLVEGQQVEIEVEYDTRGAKLLSGFTLGCAPVVRRDLVAEAVAVAAESDIAIVVVGTNDDWETEGRDRDLWELPGEQPDLIRRVAAVNSRTIVVLNVGSPHSLDWIDEPAAVLSVGFAGQELGDAVVDMLTGDVEPSGRAPTTIGTRYEHFAAFTNYPGENSVVRYGESVYCGHRWHDSLGLEPAVPFGSGLGYTTFEIGEPSARATASPGDSVALTVGLANVGDRHGAEVVQVYIEPLDPVVQRPVRELKAFRKISLDSGERADLSFELPARAFAYYDPADAVWPQLSGNGMVPAGDGVLHRTEPGWYVDAGRYRVWVGRSSRELAGSVIVQMEGDASCVS